MKKIIFTVLLSLMFIAFVFKTFNPQSTFSNQDFLSYISECPKIEVQDVITEIQNDWGMFNFMRDFFNTILFVFNFIVNIIINLINVLTTIFYMFKYFFTINTVSPGYRGGR